MYNVKASMWICAAVSKIICCSMSYSCYTLIHYYPSSSSSLRKLKLNIFLSHLPISSLSSTSLSKACVCTHAFTHTHIPYFLYPQTLTRKKIPKPLLLFNQRTYFETRLSCHPFSHNMHNEQTYRI